MSDPAPLRTALFLSPHLDDAVFSCGGTIALLSRAGWRVIVATVFTRSVANPTGFALACQLDKGLSPDVDYMALRRDEDMAACARLGAGARWLDAPEAPHRGYESAAALFGLVRSDDTMHAQLPRVFSDLKAGLPPHLTFVPEGVGGHVDHLLVRDAASAVAPIDALWRDQPYAVRHATARHPDAEAVPIAMTLPDKIAAAQAYTTQIGYQFGGPDGAADILLQAAHDDGAAREPVETFTALSAAARAALSTITRVTPAPGHRHTPIIPTDGDLAP